MSLALGGAKVENEGGRVVWDTDDEPGEETVRETGKGGGEENKGVGASGEEPGAEALVDGEAEDNNWWDCDTEARGRGGPDEEDKSPTDLVSVSRRTKVFDIFVVGV